MTTPRLTDAELAELQEKAEKSQDASMEGRTFAESVHRDFIRAAFHQAANPATVLRLLAELRQARAVVAAAEAWFDTWSGPFSPDGNAEHRASSRTLADAVGALSTHRVGGGR